MYGEVVQLTEGNGPKKVVLLGVHATKIYKQIINISITEN